MTGGKDVDTKTQDSLAAVGVLKHGRLLVVTEMWAQLRS